jgi:hypothetical protein
MREIVRSVAVVFCMVMAHVTLLEPAQKSRTSRGVAGQAGGRERRRAAERRRLAGDGTA